MLKACFASLRYLGTTLVMLIEVLICIQHNDPTPPPPQRGFCQPLAPDYPPSTWSFG
jgi:hypothetical protein